MKLIFVAISSLFFGHCILGQKWWEYSTVYQIYPRSFQDSNNDGIGDLKGIENRLVHLSSFNGSIWLSPIYESPMVDFGYDISNFTAIDPIFGTVQDLVSLIDKAHAFGIRVVLDFIPNHSSDQHPWFIKSLQREEPFTDFYIWADPKGFDELGNPIPPSNWISRFRGSMWTYREERQQFYLHQYLIQQPDLNYKNPLMKEYMFDNIKYWMDLGVDGFRFDAVTKLIEDERYLDEPQDPTTGVTDPGDWLYYDHIYTNNLPETRQILKEFYDLVKNYKISERSEERVVMLEAWLDIDSTMEYYQCGDFPFNFGFVNLEFLADDEMPTAKMVAEPINLWLENLPDGKTPDWVLGNHDRKRVGTRLGSQFIDIFNMISLTLPGIAVTYYGEEIGMVDTEISFEDTVDPWGCNCGPINYADCSRDPARTPMQWDSTANAGFSGSNITTWLPVNENYLDVNLESQEYQFSGHWFNFKTLLGYRESLVDVLGKGQTSISTEANVLFIRRWNEESTWLTLANFNADAVNLDLTSILDSNLLFITLSTTQDHYINAEYLAKDFRIFPYEGVTLLKI